jgi:hypothetical protein
MDELNKVSNNVTAAIIIAFISVIIASKNQPDNVGLGGLFIFIAHPGIMVLSIILFFAFRSFEPLKKYSFTTIALGVIYNICYAFFGY